jgi:Fe-S cluster assembly protein SufD
MSGAAVHPCIEALLGGCEPAQGRLAWLNERRARALERANALSVPTTRDEEWRFTDLAPLSRLRFRPAAAASRPAPDGVEPFFAAQGGARLVFVDGAYSEALSSTAGLPAGMVAGRISLALAAHEAAIEPHLARHAGTDNDVFAAVNTSQLRDGAFVRVARDTMVQAPVEILFVSTQPESASYPRVLAIAEAGAEFTLVERHIGLGDHGYFANCVSEIVVGAGARLRHVRVQEEARSAFHISTCAVALERDASYTSHAVTLGGRISRQNLNVVQHGEGARATIDGLTLIGGRQLADTHTLMDHARPNGSCRQMNKCIVGGGAHAVFNGKIVVRPGSQLTNSAQESRNLLLSDKAHVDTKPQLEIFADDVKCTHGATVGQLDAEQLFYLRSRGLAETGARNLLTYAFAAELIERIPLPSLVAQLERAVLEQTQST